MRQCEIINTEDRKRCVMSLQLKKNTGQCYIKTGELINADTRTRDDRTRCGISSQVKKNRVQCYVMAGEIIN